MRALLLALLTAAAFTARPAQAQWVGMDRMDESIKALFQTSAVLDKEFLADNFVLSYNELYLQGGYGGFGGYIIVPIAAATDGGYSVTTLGNIEAGVLWDVPLPLLNVTLRAGVTAPTARSDAESQTTLGFASWARLTDLVLTFPDVLGARLGVSLRLPAGILHARVDTGFDLMFPILDDGVNDQFDTIFRLNMGVGAVWKGFGATLEYVMATRIIASKIAFDGAFPHTLQASFRYSWEWVEVYVAGVLPLADLVIGETGAFCIGVQTRLSVDDGDVEQYPEIY